MDHDQRRLEPIVARTLRAAVAAEQGTAPAAGALTDLGTNLRDSPPHPAAPAVGAVAVTPYTVTEADTAAAMGHPDPSVTVLGTPRIALWFELATSPLMPEPGGPYRHVGVGLVVHHLAVAEVGEEVTFTARVIEVSGRSVVFTLEATVGDRCVARGVHQRRILDA